MTVPIKTFTLNILSNMKGIFAGVGTVDQFFTPKSYP